MSAERLQEAADALRWARSRIADLQTALVAFGDPKWEDGLSREFDGAKRTIAALDEVLETMPPAVPLTPEQEAKVGRVIAAALNKRFSDGGEAELDAAMDDWLGDGDTP